MARLPKLLALGGAAAGAFAALRRRKAQGGSSSSQATPPPTPSATNAAATPAGDVRTASPPPPDVPGPSVTPPQAGGSTTEAEERAEETAPDPEVLRAKAGGPVDQLVEEETAKAAAQAGAIGGDVPEDASDPAMDPVYQAGGGEAEGFELAEAELVESATHGDGGGDPARDAFTPEVESDLETAVHGEADEEKVTEVVEDRNPKTGAPDPDDAGAGPGITHER